MDTFLVSALILGITSNLHCLGMCGPIALAVPVKRTSIYSVISGVAQYNSGRIITYSLLGFIVGNIGITVQTIGIMQGLSIFAGIFLIFFAWRKWWGPKFRIPVSIMIPGYISKAIRKLMQSDMPLKPLWFGMLNGLLPCGMIYIALLNALLAGSPVKSMVAMTFFGIGTLPVMIAVVFMAQKIGHTLQHKAKLFVPVAMTVVGILMTLRGMNLDIPMISPKVVVNVDDTKGESIQNEVEMTCCHAPEKLCKPKE